MVAGQAVVDHVRPDSITTNQATPLFRVVNRYVGNLQPNAWRIPKDYPAPVIRNTEAGTEMALNFHVRFICL